MTRARKTLIALEDTSMYHCYVRCVRASYLCGEDAVSGRNFDHRKQWLVSRIRFLSYLFSIDVCAYSIMSNHYHVILHVDLARARLWSDEEVVERWLQLYNGHVLIDRWLEQAEMSEAELDKVAEIIARWRERLSSISWFMRCINETIARMANKEDGCHGRFWEGRFKSQALLDEVALLSCMAYVDLNPIRAGMETDLAESDFTSIQQRLFDYAKHKQKQAHTTAEKSVMARVEQQRELKRQLELDELPSAQLMPFSGSSHVSIHTALPFTREDYFALVDQTGRAIREDKKGYISAEQQPLLERLGIDSDNWIDQVRDFGKLYGNCVGAEFRIVDFSQRFNKRWSKGVRRSRLLYGKVAA